MKRGAALFLAALTVCLFCGPVRAEEGTQAEELTVSVQISPGGGDPAALTDRKEGTRAAVPAGGSVTVTAEGGIASLYVVFDRLCGPWTLSDGAAEAHCGENDFLHEFVDAAALLGGTPESVTLSFENGCSLSDIYAFGPGQVPDWVQVWQPPCENADLLLFSTHVDDEQLFFAGLLPYYAGEKGLAVQVAYLTDPFMYRERPHEQLNGLWTVGVRNYPVSGPFPDAYSESSAEAYALLERQGYSRDDVVRFQAELLRRFRPHVAVGHDINGEYGHGQHRVNSETLTEALELAADPDFDPDSAALWGVWDTPKTYLHLWKENPIVMDWDTPLEAFGGKTAFQVTQEGFLCHKSQQWTWFPGWIFGKSRNITRADQITAYSPCRYGLYRTTVGLDEAGGDMFEHIPKSYAQLAAEEEARLAEEARLREEEEAARRAAEEEARRRAEEEAAQAAPAPEEPAGASLLPAVPWLAAAVVLLAAAFCILRKIRKL